MASAITMHTCSRQGCARASGVDGQDVDLQVHGLPHHAVDGRTHPDCHGAAVPARGGAPVGREHRAAHGEVAW